MTCVGSARVAPFFQRAIILATTYVMFVFLKRTVLADINPIARFEHGHIVRGERGWPDILGRNRALAYGAHAASRRATSRRIAVFRNRDGAAYPALLVSADGMTWQCQ